MTCGKGMLQNLSPKIVQYFIIASNVLHSWNEEHPSSEQQNPDTQAFCLTRMQWSIILTEGTTEKQQLILFYFSSLDIPS